MSAENPTMDDFTRLEGKVDRIEKLFDEIAHYILPGTLGIKDIARNCGMAPMTLYNNKYRHYLPNFGKSDFPDGFRRWKRETVEEWEKIPVNERKAMWERMGRKEREMILAS